MKVRTLSEEEITFLNGCCNVGLYSCTRRYPNSAILEVVDENNNMAYVALASIIFDDKWKDKAYGLNLVTDGHYY